MKLRHFNPIRHMRLEAEVERLGEAAERLRSGVVNYIDVVGRQTNPESTAGVLRRAILAENAITVLRFHAKSILRDLERGNHHSAVASLKAITGDEPEKPDSLHVVDVVA